MPYRRITRLYIGASYLLIALLSVFGHAQNARFFGQVTDAQSAAIPQAKIDITNVDSGAQFHALSDDAGAYSVPFLTAGNYRISVQAAGFDTLTKDVSLGMGQGLEFNLALSVQGASTTVNVEGGTGSEITQLHLENSEVSGTIVGKEVAALQLNGRNFSQLIALAPGVSNQTSQDEAKVGMAGSVAYSVNGGRTEYNSFQVDGSETLNVGINKNHSTLIVYPSIDAIQEIKVLTSNYGAQYPSTGNGTTIVTTKSGTDALHGSLYEFFRNEALNAKGYFDVGNRAPLYRRNDFGGTIGGPVYIPHLYDGRGKTHFFFSEEARLETSPTAYRQGVPSLAERNGDFSDVCPSLANGTNSTFKRAAYPDCPDLSLGGQAGIATQTFTNNSLTYPGLATQEGVTSLNQNAVAILGTGIIPLPNATSGCNSAGSACYIADASLPTYWREELLRLDHVLNSKWQTGFRYIHDEWDETTPVPQYAYTQNSFPTIQNRFYAPGLSMVARLSGTFSPTFLNEFSFSYTDSYITLHDVPAAGVTLARPSGLDGPCAGPGFQCPLTTIFNNDGAGVDGVPKIPGISIAGNNAEYGGFGFASDAGYMPWEHTNPTYSFSDNLTKVLGRHNLQFGAQWVIFQRNQTNGPIGAATGDTQGLLTFSDLKVNGSTGNAFADYLFNAINNNSPAGGSGAISSFQQDSAQTKYRQRYQIVEPYFQDDFKVSPRLTLNAGLRLSLFGTFHEANNQAYNWENSAFNVAAAQTVSVQGTYGNLLNSPSGTPITINPSSPSKGLDPRIINGIVQCGTAGRPSGCMSGHLFNPAPRVGFAWDPTGAGKLAIRGGYGIFFEHGTADEANTGSLEGAAPIVLSMTQTNPIGWSTIGGGNAFPINVTAIPTKAVWSYVQQWSFSVEHELPGNALASFAYVGSVGRHLTAEREINQLVPLTQAQNPFGPHQPLQIKGANPAFAGGSDSGDCSYDTQSNSYTLLNGTVIGPGDPRYVNMNVACYLSGTGSAPNTFRTFAPGLGEIYSLENIANSSYNGFQLSARKIQGPLTLGVAYSYSHSIDDASDRSDATFVNSFDLRSNRASSNFDQRHLLHVSYIYDLPLLHALDTVLHFADSDPSNQAAVNSGSFSDSRAAKAVLGGWQVSGITLFETGIPFTVVNNGSPTGVGTLDNAGVGNGVGAGSYPDRSGLSSHLRLPAEGNNGKSFGPLLLNPSAFVAPQGLTFGNAGRNDLNNPNRWNWDLTLLKHTQLGEHVDAEFRTEAFNVFNNTQFRIYDPVLGTQAQNTVSCYGGSVSYYSAAGGDGSDCLTGSSFLHPVDAHRPRTIQFALKLSF
ncbi:Oar protein [Acidisarcina polymorpha]|uniref:Oar protein n=1 Tax=Acidisarcina polymorpha TaxID=2211140 RepID=A0A2Z5FS23_9BACT|nr:carboxypeptidase-like regulatory domain-containing protein [Acidisarcina polymorpha]AXC09542.1 Oar protein [Acidisarcina polymorpha]